AAASAGGGPAGGVRRTGTGGQGATARHVECGHRPVAGSAIRVRDVEVSGVSRRELAAEWAWRLRRERGPACRREPPVVPNHEAVNEEGAGIGRPDLDAD